MDKPQRRSREYWITHPAEDRARRSGYAKKSYKLDPAKSKAYREANREKIKANAKARYHKKKAERMERKKDVPITRDSALNAVLRYCKENAQKIRRALKLKEKN